jgi:hypothetical protein
MKVIYMECTIQYMQLLGENVDEVMNSGIVKVIDGMRPYLVTEIL